jgi:hypothetical protein
MKKIIPLFLVFFVILIYTASSLKTFEINETEKISLGLDVEDPDADKLSFTFTKPLDKNGEWQTTYGDEGEYDVVVTVSDGQTEVSEGVFIIVNRKEAAPVFNSFKPKKEFITIDEDNDLKFKVEVSDPNKDVLRFEWLLNGEVVSNNKEYFFETGYEDAGEYNIEFIARDGVFDVSKSWSITVNDVDLKGILAKIEDVTVLEGSTVKLNLPNFKKYDLRYEISDPLRDNKWKTGFDDSGEYAITITVDGDDFEWQEEVKITVENNDRAPKFIDLRGVSINENEEARIELRVEDPDGESVSLSAENIPEGAELDGNVFIWKPGFDFVQKNNVFDYFVDKFKLLRRSVGVVFTAQSNELETVRNVKITVRDVNRPFSLERIRDIEVNEGQEVIIEPKYTDPDNDLVSFSYSGFMGRDKKNVGYEDAGEYIVKVVATDGFFTETRFVKVVVNDVNRKPEFDMVDTVEVKEDEEVRIELNALDPDNDVISFSLDSSFGKLKDNLFVWKADSILNETVKEFNVDFSASDGSEEVSQTVKIKVLNVNQGPKIVSTSDNLIAIQDEPMLFEVDVSDMDGDKLTYSWDFGFFDKFESKNQHQRIFTSEGSKKVEVTISDGKEEVVKVWNVEVV